MSARSLWFPLMGTGAGGLLFDHSFNITFGAIRASGWFSQPGVHATISTPEKLPFDAARTLNAAINEVWQALTDDAVADSSASSDVDRLAKTPAVAGLTQKRIARSTSRRSASRKS